MYGVNPWATGGLWVKSTIGEGGLISFPLLLLEGNVILPMTPKAGCESTRHSKRADFCGSGGAVGGMGGWVGGRGGGDPMGAVLQ